jgi:ribonucleoside-diphosphate reductase beta chain
MYQHVTNPECRQYMLRQAYEEAVHTDTFIYCCDTLGLDPDDVFKMYETIPTIKEKDDFVVDITKNILTPGFNTKTTEGIQAFIMDAVGFYVIMEGIFFYAGFVMMLSMMRQRKMAGLGEQFQYILRDESVHLAFGADLINQIVIENPQAWTDELKLAIRANIIKAVELEYQYAKDSLPRGVLGLNADAIYEYLKYIADRRLERINLPKEYAVGNPFPWMSEIIDLKKEKNFFETRVNEYQTAGSLDW